VADPTSAPHATLLQRIRERPAFAIFSLALGGFGIGVTEFVAMGLLTRIAQDVLPGMWAQSQDQAIGTAGIVISAYALGVVVGAPLLAALTARFSRRRILILLAVAFTIGTVASALAPTFELLLLARFIAALPHGAFFGIAMLTAARLLGPERRARGVAFVISGLTIANVIGVPLITGLGQAAGWRVAYLAVAGVFAIALLALVITLPPMPAEPGTSIRGELTALKNGQVWIVVCIGAIGFGGFFAVYSYVDPLVTQVAHLPEGFTPFALATLGVGMTIGNLAGGRFADRGVLRTMFVGFAAFAVALLVVGLTSWNPVGLFIGLFAVGAGSSLMIPAIQTRLMDVGGKAQNLSAALNHSALNIGNALGAALGGIVIAAGWGAASTAWVGLILCVPGVALVWASASYGRRRALRTPATLSA
jgi:DHA1 family inner membrane transport protein